MNSNMEKNTKKPNDFVQSIWHMQIVFNIKN